MNRRYNGVRIIAWVVVLVTAAMGTVRGSDIGGNPSKAIPDMLVYADADFGSEAETPCAVIVDKTRQQIKVVGRHKGWTTLAKWPCSTGRQQGPKKREGDQKTPVGVYFATRDVRGAYLSATYGSRALPLDYPNVPDRRSERTGSAIWLHGTNKPLRPRDSNGCVVLENRDIDALSRYIQLNRTPVIIVEQARLWPEKRARQIADQLLTTASQWHDAMMVGSYQAFCRYYTPGAEPSMRWWQRWCRFRIRQGRAFKAEYLMRRRAIFKAEHYYVLLFDHNLKLEGQEEWAGSRKLYFSAEEERFLIFADDFQSMFRTGEDPLFTAWRKLWKNKGQRSRMAVTRNAAKPPGHGDM